MLDGHHTGVAAKQFSESVDVWVADGPNDYLDHSWFADELRSNVDRVNGEIRRRYEYVASYQPADGQIRTLSDLMEYAGI